MSVSINSWGSNDDSSAQRSVGANDVTRIPVGADIRQGVLISTNDIRIDGRFYGSVLTKGKVILGEQAIVKGDIVCENADIYGTMEGSIITGDVLTLMGTCYLSGVISINKFCVENGARFEGTCRVLTKDEYAKLFNESETKFNKENPAIELEIEKKRKMGTGVGVKPSTTPATSPVTSSFDKDKKDSTSKS